MDLVSMLKKEGAIDDASILSKSVSMTRKTPVIEIPIYQSPDGPTGILYDSVTIQGNHVLMQARGGDTYLIRQKPEGLHYTKIHEEEEIPFGIIGLYPSEYFIVNPEYFNKVKENCKNFK